MCTHAAIILLLMIICMVSTVIVYGWICDLFKYFVGGKSDASAADSQVCTASRLD